MNTILIRLPHIVQAHMQWTSDDELAEILHRRHILLHILAMSGLIILETIKLCILLYSSRFNRVPQHTSILSGQDWLNKLIAGHDGCFYNETGMKKHWTQVDSNNRHKMCITLRILCKKQVNYNVPTCTSVSTCVDISYSYCG